MRVIAITGGKGGIGKTTISINLAITLAQSGQRVILFDADLGLANVDVMLGIKPKRNIADYFSGECALDDICVKGPYGISIIPGSSGIQKMADLTTNDSANLINSFCTLTNEYDVMLVDVASGISHQVIDMTHAAQHIMVVVCNEPSSLVDSYAVVKLLHQKYKRHHFGIVVNKVKHLEEGYQVFSQFQAAMLKFIDVSLHYIGHVPQDDYIRFATLNHCAVVEKFAHAISTTAFHDMTHSIDYWCQQSQEMGGIQFFFEKIVKNHQLQTI